jgi:uncharacterized membrane protein YbjE (DUF340 family)
MSDIAGILGILLAGMLCGYAVRSRERVRGLSDRLLVWMVYALLFFLGVNVGTDRAVLGRLGEYGAQAFVLAVAGVAGSVAVTRAVAHWAFEGESEPEGPGPAADLPRDAP